MHLLKQIYHQHVRNAVLDVCAKSVPVWGKNGEMRGLFTGRKNISTCPFIVIDISDFLSHFRLQPLLKFQNKVIGYRINKGIKVGHRNAVLDVCAKSVPVWGKNGEMRGLLPGEKLSRHVLLLSLIYQTFSAIFVCNPY